MCLGALRACGAVIGFLISYGLWKLGFEIIGSAVAWAGAVIGGIVGFLGVLSRYGDRWAEG